MSNSLRYTPLANDTDELPQLMKGYTTSFIEYCLYKAYSLDQKDDTGDKHYQKAVMMQARCEKCFRAAWVMTNGLFRGL